MEYNFREIESKWRAWWQEQGTYRVTEKSDRPKYYVLDMFPYPSGAGLHVGHPLGYIASDVYARYKRLLGYNVLHPMGYDSFGLPAEQYAIQTGQHPAKTTEQNIKRYREQLDKIGFSFDWSREVRTSDPDYYRWTQWTFCRMFESWYNRETGKAEPIESLIKKFEQNGTYNVDAHLDGDWYKSLPRDEFPFGEHFSGEFTNTDWKSFNDRQKQIILQHFRLAYLADTWVNWCPALGTVLANDEVKDGFSERGGHPVEQRLMKQWNLRITAFADRLLNDLEKVEWPEPIREMQRNWIGKSKGASVRFKVDGHAGEEIEVFTTRPDTIFGVTFMTLAPEHPLVKKITTPEQKKEVEDYVEQASRKSERERQAEVKKVTGVFTGGHAIHPFTGDSIPIWIGDYVLSTYGTGAVMAVPAGDQRDWNFANHFGIPIKNIFADVDIAEGAYDSDEGVIANSGFLSGLPVKKAVAEAIAEIERKGIGRGRTNYRLRDAIFSRQRYWGEPFPVYYKDGLPYLLDDNELPLELPPVDKYLPTEEGEPPLARAKKEDWPIWKGDGMEYSTMPGWAGSSWYFLRYMDPHNEDRPVDPEKANYWGQVDFYIGGAEHATGHLLYSRFWTKFLYDRELIPFDEPFKRMINQGMILGRSNFVYREKGSNRFISYGKRKEYETQRIHVDVNIVENDVLDIDAFKKWRPEFADAEFVLEDGKYICGHEVEKMSKSKYNVQTPDDLVEQYGADTLRMYEMFLGPIEQAKPWDTQGISGVHNFLKKLWRLFFDRDGKLQVTEDAPAEDSLKTLHKTIKKVTEDLERLAFNTPVSAFMICANELTDQDCHSKEVLETLTILLSPYAPHASEELWHQLGHEDSVCDQKWPEYQDRYLEEDTIEYPVSFNGKMRFKMHLPADMDKKEVEETVLASEDASKYLDNKDPKKVIVVPGRIVNIVV